MQSKISTINEIIVRFNEVDSMDIVWHGNYVKYIEDGREFFGRKYGLSYSLFMEKKIFVPIVKIQIDYKKSLKFDDMAIIETTYVQSAPAKLMFDYKIFNQEQELMCTAQTTQVFLDTNRNLQLVEPEFYTDWKTKWLY